MNTVQNVMKSFWRNYKIDQHKERIMSKIETLELIKEKRQKCIVYTRVMGYHRPVESFNLGKLGEHKQRVQFKTDL